MADRPMITPAEMDRMTPNERLEAVRAGTVHDLDELPAAFRARIEARAAELETQLASRAT